MENNVNEFKDFLKKGPENYILTLQKVGGVNQLYSEYFENIEKIKDVFDLYGGFTTYIYEDFNAYFDKSLREEPMDSFNTFCKKSFGDLDYKIQMAFIFRDKEGIYIREYTKNDKLKSERIYIDAPSLVDYKGDNDIAHINKLWNEDILPDYYLKITYNGIEE